MNLKKPLISVVLIIAFLQCKNENKTHSVKLNENIKYLELYQFKNKEFDFLISELYDFIKLIHPDCKAPKIHYKKLTKLEIKNIEKTLIFNGNRYCEKKQDSSLIDLKYDYYDFSQKNILSNYDKNDFCQFYFGGVFHSKDYKIQFIRLFQEGVNEKMDLLIRGKEVIAFG